MMILKSKYVSAETFLEQLEAEMKNFPQIDFYERDEGIVIYSRYDHGYDIYIGQTSFDGYIVGFGHWYMTTYNPSKAIRYLRLGLSEGARVEVDGRQGDILVWRFHYLKNGRYKRTSAIETRPLEPNHAPEDPNHYYLQNTLK